MARLQSVPPSLALPPINNRKAAFDRRERAPLIDALGLVSLVTPPPAAFSVMTATPLPVARPSPLCRPVATPAPAPAAPPPPSLPLWLLLSRSFSAASVPDLCPPPLCGDHLLSAIVRGQGHLGSLWSWWRWLGFLCLGESNGSALRFSPEKGVRQIGTAHSPL
jgi:hypothetical protein